MIGTSAIIDPLKGTVSFTFKVKEFTGFYMIIKSVFIVLKQRNLPSKVNSNI